MRSQIGANFWELQENFQQIHDSIRLIVEQPFNDEIHLGLGVRVHELRGIKLSEVGQYLSAKIDELRNCGDQTGEEFVDQL